MNNIFKITTLLFALMVSSHSFAQVADCENCTKTVSEETMPLPLRNSQFMKNFLETGVLYSTAYGPAADVRFNLVNKKKSKVSWSIESSYSNYKGLEGITVAINKHIGKRGIYVGGNGQLAQFDIEYIDGSPSAQIPFLGIQAGWRHYWGKDRRISSLIQVGVEGVQYEFKNLIMPEARAGVFYRIGGGKVNQKK